MTEELPEELPSREDQQKVIDWLKVKQRPGKPTCPCGLTFGTRKICDHRKGCPTWKAYARMSKWISQWNIKNTNQK